VQQVLAQPVPVQAAPTPVEVPRPLQAAPVAATPEAAAATPAPAQATPRNVDVTPSFEQIDAFLADVVVEQDPKPLFDPDKPFGSPASVTSGARFDESAAALDAEMAAVLAPAKPSGSRKKLAIAVAVVAVLATGGFLGFQKFASPAAVPEMATLSVQSNPPGVAVFVDGVERGMTPARVTLAAGAHILELRGRGVPRVIPVNLAAGADVSQYLEIAEAPLPEQPMTVPAPTPAAPPVSAAPAETTGAPLAGWISVKLPFSVEIREGGRLLGTTDADRLMLAAGKHELEFANATLAFSVTRTVQVTPGKVSNVALELPKGVVNLNAAPWAEVWIDGQRVGETPIGNLSVVVGPHEIVFKHPQLGEKRHAVSVTAGAPVRLSIDMKQ
jgi:hypothetical protein